jgi:Lon protease-like protein
MQLPAQVPVMILPNATLFPQMTLPLRIFEPRYRRMLADVLEGDRVFAVALRKAKSRGETPSSIGGLGLVSAAVEHPDGTSHIVLHGLARVEFLGPIQRKPYRIEAIRGIASPPPEPEATNRLARKVRALVRRRVKQGFNLGLPAADDPAKATQFQQMQELANLSLRRFAEHMATVKSPEHLADLVASTLVGDPYDRQLLLATPQVEARLQFLLQFLLADFQSQSPLA